MLNDPPPRASETGTILAVSKRDNIRGLLSESGIAMLTNPWAPRLRTQGDNGGRHGSQVTTNTRTESLL